MTNRLLGFSTLLAGLVAFPAGAQDVAGAASALEECRAIGSDSKRLQCYDAALDAMYGVNEELQAKRAQYRRDRFGLPVDDNGTQLTELEAIVSEVDEDLRTGAVTVALDNGQVWQLNSTGGLRARFRPGMTVVINESGTGGYRIRIPDKTGFKGVNRVR